MPMRRDDLTTFEFLSTSEFTQNGSFTKWSVGWCAWGLFGCLIYWIFPFPFSSLFLSISIQSLLSTKWPGATMKPHKPHGISIFIIRRLAICYLCIEWKIDGARFNIIQKGSCKKDEGAKFSNMKIEFAFNNRVLVQTVVSSANSSEIVIDTVKKYSVFLQWEWSLIKFINLSTNKWDFMTLLEIFNFLSTAHCTTDRGWKLTSILSWALNHFVWFIMMSVTWRCRGLRVGRVNFCRIFFLQYSNLRANIICAFLFILSPTTPSTRTQTQQ